MHHCMHLSYCVGMHLLFSEEQYEQLKLNKSRLFEENKNRQIQWRCRKCTKQAKMNREK